MHCHSLFEIIQAGSNIMILGLIQGEKRIESINIFSIEC
jgi:hypothetical protein